ncbi:MAG: T9SS type A sorting domain-containing protein, partial [Paludibacter sp.]|nr:T9SS type A sorting domain-containing protein [Paludibacter sp.]
KLNDTINLFQGNTAAENVAGVTSFTSENKRFTLELQSGEYTFETRNASTSSIRNIKKKDEITVYPNPVTHELKITDCELKESDNVQIFDISGRSAGAYSIRHNRTIDVSHLQSGIYFLKINDKVAKFCKE